MPGAGLLVRLSVTLGEGTVSSDEKISLEVRMCMYVYTHITVLYVG